MRPGSWKCRWAAIQFILNYAGFRPWPPPHIWQKCPSLRGEGNKYNNIGKKPYFYKFVTIRFFTVIVIFVTIYCNNICYICLGGGSQYSSWWAQFQLLNINNYTEINFVPKNYAFKLVIAMLVNRNISTTI